MSANSRLDELLRHWYRLRNEGQEASLDELCREAPELREQLREALLRGAPCEQNDTKHPDLISTITFDRDESPGSPGNLDPSSISQLSVPGFEILGELGRGGMGVVLLARDLELDREVAVKVLRHGRDSWSDASVRFSEEAHINGQLQHPGIAPVYRLGTLSDQSPFFAMKLVRGRTLAELLADRHDPSQDRSRLLKIFQQVCQTLAYAHSRHVIHRDLKPSNIMVGAFGEVQVMDWGLAKVLSRHGGARHLAELSTNEDGQIRTPRVQGAHLNVETNTGSVLGTLSYMPPEQALGAIDRLDERSDVFSLGGTLCEILTGKPPYVAESSIALFHKARTADLADATARLNVSGADLELITLTKRCLSALPEDRPTCASVLAAELTEYLESVDVRFRQAELQRAKAEVSVREERRRRKLAVALAFALVLLMSVGGAAFFWFRGRQSETVRIASVAIGKAEELREQASQMKVTGEIVASRGIDILDQADTAVREAEAAVAVWSRSRLAVEEAEAVLASGVAPASLHARVGALKRGIESEHLRLNMMASQLVRERQLLQDLESARLAKSGVSEGKLDYAASTQKFAEVFAKYGFSFRPGENDGLTARISAERPSVREALIVALDDWSADAGNAGTWPSPGELKIVAAGVDTNSWRKRLRETRDPKVLEGLFWEVQSQPHAPSSISLLAKHLQLVGQIDKSIELLRWARARYPTDFWLHYTLGGFLSLKRPLTDAQAEEQIGCFRAALALRPRTAVVHFNLGVDLQALNRLGEAVTEYRLANEIDPSIAGAHTNLGNALAALGHHDEAFAASRKAVEVDPKSAVAHYNFGRKLVANDRLDEAISHFRLATILDPKNPVWQVELGNSLKDKNLVNEASAVLQQAIELDPKHAESHNSLGALLADQSKFDEAISEYRLAIENDPNHAGAHSNLGVALAAKNLLDQAVAEHRQAIEIDPKNASFHNNLANALLAQRRFEEAVAEYRIALEIDPSNQGAHSNLGAVLTAMEQWDAAIAEYRLALNLDPSLPEAHTNLGVALAGKGQLAAAVAEYRLAIELDPKAPNPYMALGLALRDMGEFAKAKDNVLLAIDLLPRGSPLRPKCDSLVRELDLLVTREARLPGVLSGSDKLLDDAERRAFIDICRLTRRFDGAADLCLQAFAVEPGMADDLDAGHRYNAACFAALAGRKTPQSSMTLDAMARARLRRQAVDWLRADLAAWKAKLESDNPEDKQLARVTLRFWKGDPDLAGLRDPAEIQALPADERESCEQLWLDVESLLRAGNDAPKQP